MGRAGSSISENGSPPALLAFTGCGAVNSRRGRLAQLVRASRLHRDAANAENPIKHGDFASESLSATETATDTPQRAISSAVERFVYTEDVGGSIPSSPTTTAVPLKAWASAAATTLYDAIDRAKTPDQLDHVARTLWDVCGEGAISEDDATFLSECIDRRRPMSRRASALQAARPLRRAQQRTAPRLCREANPRSRRVMRGGKYLPPRVLAPLMIPKLRLMTSTLNCDMSNPQRGERYVAMVAAVDRARPTCPCRCGLAEVGNTTHEISHVALVVAPDPRCRRHWHLALGGMGNMEGEAVSGP
jgi:hypothetical protein